MKDNFVAAPNDSRYVPFTQQNWCCVPTSVLMIMYKNDIPLIPAEELGYRLGLTVPPEVSDIFYKPRISETPPTDAGFGTQVLSSDYSFNKVFPELNIPLTAEIIFTDKIENEDIFMSILSRVEQDDTDALLCFDHGTLRVDGTHNGHVVVFDRIIDGQIRIVDASPRHPKWRLIEPAKMLEAMRNHPMKGTGGIWKFTAT
jgi:hypothetical protein